MSILATLCHSFPLRFWFRLVPLATTTLNLIRLARINPMISAYEFLHWAFDYDKKMSPPGSKVLAHDATLNRRTWTPYGTEGRCTCMAPNHHRWHKLHVLSNLVNHLAFTVTFFPYKAPVPHNTVLEEAVSIANKLACVLSSSDFKPLFADNNDSVVVIAKLSVIYFQSCTRSHTKSSCHHWLWTRCSVASKGAPWTN